MAGSRVHRARAGVQRDVVAVDDGALEVLADGARVGEAGEFAALERDGLAVLAAHEVVGFPARDLGHLFHQLARHDHVGAVRLDHHVVGVGRQRHGRVRRKRPGRGGPDEHVGVARSACSLEHAGHDIHLELHEDGRRRLVGVLDLGLGKRRVAALAPVDGFAAAVHRAVEVHLLEHLDVARLVVRREREVRMLPIGVHAEALEALALHVDVFLGPFAAEAAQRGLVDLGHFVGAESLLHHMLDGLAVAVPAGHVGREEPALRMGLVHEVLEDLVEGMADMDGAVGVRRAVVQDEGLAVLVLLENLLVDMLFFPLGQTLRLALGQVSPHREVGLRQVHRFFVRVRHGCRTFPQSMCASVAINRYSIVERTPFPASLPALFKIATQERDAKRYTFNDRIFTAGSSGFSDRCSFKEGRVVCR